MDLGVIFNNANTRQSVICSNISQHCRIGQEVRNPTYFVTIAKSNQFI